MRRLAQHRDIGIEEGDTAFHPVSLQQHRPPFAGLRRGGDAARLGRRGGIVEAAQQARGIAQRVGPGAPFGHRPCRFALEIDDVGIGLHHQHLAEMEIAMHAGAERALGGAGQDDCSAMTAELT